MSVTTLDAATRMAMSAPHGEPPLAGRPGPPWRTAMIIAILLAILLHLAGLWLIVEGPRWSARPEVKMAIPVTIVMPPPPRALPKLPKPPPKPPEPKPPEPKPAPPPPPPPPPEPQSQLRQSGPDQRTTVLRDDMEKAKPKGGSPSPGPKAAPPPEPTAPPQPPRPAPQKPPNARRPTPPPSKAPPRPSPSRQPQAQLGPNGFVLPSRPERQAYAPQALSRNPYDFAAPYVSGSPGKEDGFYAEGLTGDPYLNLLRDRVKRNLPPDNDLAPIRHVEVYLAINRDGTFAGYNFIVRSGQDRIDQMVLLAIQRAAPMPPVPPDFPGGDPIQLTGIISVPSF